MCNRMPDSNLLSLILFLLFGGGKDLVSYIPPQIYWESKGVEMVTVDTLLPDIAAKDPNVDVEKLVTALGSDEPAVREKAAKSLLSAGPAIVAALDKEANSPDVEVARQVRIIAARIRTEAKPREIRRLMAIRTLGDLKDAKALPALKALTASTEPFVADYANEAIAKIEGKPAPARQRDAKAMAADLELLPSACAIVLQIQPKPGLATTIEAAAAKTELEESGKKTRLRHGATELIETAERLGNIRVDGLTIGISGDFTLAKGHIIAIVRGQYDPEFAPVAARREQMPVTTVGGRNLYQWGLESYLLFPSSDRLVLLASMDPQQLPAGEVVKALESGKGTLRKNAELSKLIDTADALQPIWGVGKLTAALQAAPPLEGVDAIKLVGTQDADKVELKLTTTGADPAKAQAAAKAAEALVHDPLQELQKLAEFMPPLRLARDFLKSIRFAPSEGTITGTATWSGSITDLYLFDVSGYTTPVEQPK
jgi:hypothetical protein